MFDLVHYFPYPTCQQCRNVDNRTFREILASTTSSAVFTQDEVIMKNTTICDFPNEPTPKDHFKCRYSTNKYPELYGKLESFMFQQSTNGQDIRRDSGVDTMNISTISSIATDSCIESERKKIDVMAFASCPTFRWVGFGEFFGLKVYNIDTFELTLVVAKGSKTSHSWENCTIKSHVNIEGNTTIGDDCTIFPYAAIGGIPQDKKFNIGDETMLDIGNSTTIREHVTINTGTLQGAKIPIPRCPHFTRQSNQSSITTSSPNSFILLRRTVLL